MDREWIDSSGGKVLYRVSCEFAMDGKVGRTIVYTFLVTSKNLLQVRKLVYS